MAANAARTNIETPTEKRCGRCGKVKPAAAFYTDRRRRDGLYANCNLCHRKITDGWKASNPEVVSRISKASYGRNAEAHRKASRDYHRAHRDRIVARMAEQKRLNRAVHTAYETVRRGRKAGAAGWATPEQIAARVAYYGGRCWMCGAPWEQIDHVKPLRVGGPNWPANLRPACGSCNGRKNGVWPYPTKAA